MEAWICVHGAREKMKNQQIAHKLLQIFQATIYFCYTILFFNLYVFQLLFTKLKWKICLNWNPQCEIFFISTGKFPNNIPKFLDFSLAAFLAQKKKKIKRQAFALFLKMRASIFMRIIDLGITTGEKEVPARKRAPDIESTTRLLTCLVDLNLTSLKNATRICPPRFREINQRKINYTRAKKCFLLTFVCNKMCVYDILKLICVS